MLTGAANLLCANRIQILNGTGGISAVLVYIRGEGGGGREEDLAARPKLEIRGHMDPFGFFISGSGVTSSEDFSLGGVLSLEADGGSEASVNQGAQSEPSEAESSVVSSLSDNDVKAQDAGIGGQDGEDGGGLPAIAYAKEGYGDHDPDTGCNTANPSHEEYQEGTGQTSQGLMEDDAVEESSNSVAKRPRIR